MTRKSLSPQKQVFAYKLLPLAMVALVCAGQIPYFLGRQNEYLLPMATVSTGGYLVLAVAMARGAQGLGRSVLLHGLSFLVIALSVQRLLQNLIPSWPQVLQPQLFVDYGLVPFAANRLSSICAIGLIFLNLALLVELRSRWLAIVFTMTAWFAAVFALNGLVVDTSYLTNGISFFSVASLVIGGTAMALRLSAEAPFLVLFKGSGLGLALRIVSCVIVIEPLAVGLFVSEFDTQLYYVSASVTHVVAIIASIKLAMILAVASVFDQNQTLLQQAAEFDHLTGLLNRHGLERELANNSFNSVVMLDIDHFKQINDALGHAAGDKLLVAVAKTLSGCLGPDDVVVRWGGDEFIVLTQEHGQERLQALCEGLRKAITTLPALHLATWRFQITMSLGYAQIDFGTQGFAGAVSRADQALYAAKYAGRNKTRGERAEQVLQQFQAADMASEAKV